MEFHGIIVENSLGDPSIGKSWDIIEQEVDGNWVMDLIRVSENDLDNFIKNLQNNMNKGTWYAHFYNHDGSKLVVVFKEKVFKTNNKKENWGEIMKYGKDLNIPIEQLDFLPNTFASE